MLKRVIVLLLFVQFSFGQENESSLELAKEQNINRSILGKFFGNHDIDINMIIHLTLIIISKNQ